MSQRPFGGNRSYGPERKTEIAGKVLFFACFFFYTWLRISPRLLYYNNPELFLLDSGFFKGFLYYPGGLANYISRFLLEFYYFNWPGALIITLFTFLICLQYSWYLKNVIDRPLGILFFIPAILVFIVYNQYSSLSLVGLFLVLLCVNIYTKIGPERILAKIILYLALSVFVYCVAVYSYWLFSAICAIWEIIRNRKYVLGYLYLGIGIWMVYITAEYILCLKGSDIFYQFWLEPVPNKLLYSFFLLAPILLPLIKKWNRALDFSLLILFLPAILLSFNKGAHSFLKINYFSQEKNWEEVLKEAKRIPYILYEENKSLYEIVFKALYRSGRLPEEQFNYPHHLLFNMPYPRPQTKLIDYASPVEISDTVFSLGLINHSELMASWALEVTDNLVRPIQQQAMIFILKGNDRAAQTLLNRMKKSFLYKKWAQKYALILKNKALLEKEPYLAEARARMIKQDDPKDIELLTRIAYKYDYEGVFKRLLAENKNNKMAFEYLMAYYLLMGQTEKIVENLSWLDSFGYAQIPRNYQEAILINMFKAGYMDPKLKERINPFLEEQYLYFNEIYRKFNHDKIATYNALKEKYGNSYFLYYIMLTKR